MQDKARADLARLFAEQLDEAGLKAEAVTTYATPRRLVLIASGLPTRPRRLSEELKGPRTSAPPQALEGFLRKTGLTQAQLEERDGVWFATIAKPGRATATVLGEAIPAIVRASPGPSRCAGARPRLDREPALGPPAAQYRRPPRRSGRRLRNCRG
jgi:glycyl-tRNA synthetase beta chain